MRKFTSAAPRQLDTLLILQREEKNTIYSVSMTYTRKNVQIEPDWFISLFIIVKCAIYEKIRNRIDHFSLSVRQNSCVDGGYSKKGVTTCYCLISDTLNELDQTSLHGWIIYLGSSNAKRCLLRANGPKIVGF